jgi:hypothetical protein
MEGGKIWFGGFDSSYVSGSVQYTSISSYNSTPALTTNSAFYVELKTVSLNGSDMGYDETLYGDPANYGGMIADTGTSLAYLPATVVANIATELDTLPAFVNQFGGSSFFTGGTCMSSTTTPAVTMTPAQLDAALPPLVLTFANAAGGADISISLPASRSYLDMHWTSSAQTHFQYCPGIASDGGAGPDIIGGSLMRSQIVIFDRDNARVGFGSQQPLGTATTGCTH